MPFDSTLLEIWCWASTSTIIIGEKSAYLDSDYTFQKRDAMLRRRAIQGFILKCDTIPR